MSRESIKLAAYDFCNGLAKRGNGSVTWGLHWSDHIEDPIWIVRRPSYNKDCGLNHFVHGDDGVLETCRTTLDLVIDGCECCPTPGLLVWRTHADTNQGHTSANGYRHWKAGGNYTDECHMYEIRRDLWDPEDDSHHRMQALVDDYKPRQICGRSMDCFPTRACDRGMRPHCEFKRGVAPGRCECVSN